MLYSAVGRWNLMEFGFHCNVNTCSALLSPAEAQAARGSRNGMSAARATAQTRALSTAMMLGTWSSMGCNEVKIKD
jgi:hypothetical protein